MHLDVIIFVGSRPEVYNITPRWKDELITETEVWKTRFQNPHLPRPQPREEHGNNTTAAAYLPAPSVDAKGRQKGVEDHMAGFYVDWRLPFPHGAKIPS